MKKKLIVIAVSIIVVGLGWYFFVKPQDYQIRVKVKSYPAVINQTLKLWNKTLNNSSIEQINDLGQLKQTIVFMDTTHIYNWNIHPITDSTSLLKVDVTDQTNSIKNRLFIPFVDTYFEKKSRNTVTDFVKNLNEHLKSFKVTIVGEEKLESTYCACVEHTSLQSGKASEMMQSYPFLNSVVSKNNIELNGIPFIETTAWNLKNDSISFNFCYPIIQSDSLPKIKGILYKTFTGKNSLKAVYNGNYITSDRAWYELLNYAKDNNIKVDRKPIEFFYNNPNMGGDALRWKAEVFMPILAKDE